MLNQTEDMDRSHNMGGHSMMMSMYYHFHLGDQVLFKSLVVDTPIKMVLACGLFFILAIFHEYIKFVRVSRCKCIEDRGTACQATSIERRPPCQRKFFHNSTYVRVFQMLLHATQLALSYTLMLVAMTFSVWLILSIIVGEY